MEIITYAWIPRSYIHLAEIFKKLDKIPFKTKETTYTEKRITFKIEEYKGYKNIIFSLNGDGTYKVKGKIKLNSEIKNFYEISKQIILDIFRVCHRVTFQQIVEEILPLVFHVVVLSKKDLKIKNLTKYKSGNLILYSNDAQSYFKNTISYICGPYENKEEIIDIYAFPKLLGRFFYIMMDKMEDYHNNTKKVIEVLETRPKSKEVYNAYLNLDLVKKDAAETWAKIEQAINILYTKKQKINFNQKIIKDLHIKDSFERVYVDKDYIITLWQLLINHLEYVDTAVEARVNYNILLSNQSSKWFGLINSGFILGAIITSLFMIAKGTINTITSFIILLIAWVGVYELINYKILKR